MTDSITDQDVETTRLRGFHTWISNDDDYVSCLTCGAVGLDSEPDDVASAIVGGDGERIAGCSGDTTQCHHYSGECAREAYTDDDSPCNRDIECNCYTCH